MKGNLNYILYMMRTHDICAAVRTIFCLHGRTRDVKGMHI